MRGKDTNTFGASGCAKIEWPNRRPHLLSRGIRDEAYAHDGEVHGKGLAQAASPEEAESIEEIGAAFQFDQRKFESRPFAPAIPGGKVPQLLPVLCAGLVEVT